VTLGCQAAVIESQAQIVSQAAAMREEEVAETVTTYASSEAKVMERAAKVVEREIIGEAET
jgi:hypothetical protein